MTASSQPPVEPQPEEMTPEQSLLKFLTEGTGKFSFYRTAETSGGPVSLSLSGVMWSKLSAEDREFLRLMVETFSSLAALHEEPRDAV